MNELFGEVVTWTVSSSEQNDTCRTDVQCDYEKCPNDCSLDGVNDD